MMHLIWLFIFPFNFGIYLLCMILNPLVALFVTKRGGREYLVQPLYWFQTHDNAVDEWWWGCFNESSALAYFRDATQAQYDKSAFLRYACRVMWLWRNVGYGFAYNVFGRKLDEELWIKERVVEKQGFWYKLTQRRSSFQLKMTIPTPWFWYLDINIGWKTHKGFPRAMYAGRLIGSGA